MRRFCVGLWVLHMLRLCLLGQGQEPLVSVTVVPPAEPLKSGESRSVPIEVKILDRYHINANQPLEDFLIPTTVDLKPQGGVRFGTPVFPLPAVKQLEISENPMAIYEGTVRVQVPISLDAAFDRNELVLEGELRYQACNDRACFPPAKAAFRRAIPVAFGRPPVSPAREAAPAPMSEPRPPAAAQEPLKPPAEAVGPPKPSAEPSGLEGKGLPLTVVLVFLGGLALTLTPCVYPLIPITIGYFGGQAEGRKGSVVAHSFLYVIGMAATYSVMGVVAAFTGSLFGSALQYPAVLIGIALVMVLLALSMFNVYELRLPAFLNRLTGGSQRGFAGSLIMGLTVGVVAAPCIGPFVLGLLTYVGEKGSVVLGFSLFFVLAMGMGLPFLILGIFSGSINRLPRSGAWMVWARTIFGFVLIAMAIYFVRSLLPNSLYYHLGLSITMLLAGVYMAWIEPTQSAGRIFPFVRNGVGVAFFLLALGLAVNGVQSYVDAAAGIRWAPYSDQALAEAVKTGRPVLIDFFTEWCVACKELDEKTFSDPEVIAASRKFVTLKSDLTSADDPRVKAMSESYAIKGVPTLVFLSADGKELPELRVTGFETKNEFLPKMRRALEAGAMRGTASDR
ncbi:MAG: cytochrome c biogenesis protein CcdA [Acidobacteriota bacterium]